MQDNITTVPRYKVNLDDPPAIRWQEVVDNNMQEIQGMRQMIRNEFGDVIPPFILKLVDTLGKLVSTPLSFFVAYGNELKGIAKATKLPLAEVLLIQFMYEAASCCTSIIMPHFTEQDVPCHIRTMDWEMTQLKSLTIEVEFWSQGQPLFVSTTWPGYIGTLTAMKPYAFSSSVNFRVTGEGYWQNVKQAILYAWPIGFLLRRVFEEDTSYTIAVNSLALSELIAPVYFTVCGVRDVEGCILTRNRSSEEGDRCLLANGVVVQTNIDYWSDDADSDILYSIQRRELAKRLCNGLQEVTKENLFAVLSRFPIRNDLTVSATWMCPALNQFETRLPQSSAVGFRECQSPEPMGGEERIICKSCKSKYMSSVNPTGQCAHIGDWHSEFSHCAKFRCGMGLGVTNIGKCHWSCCYSTNYSSPCRKSPKHD